MKMERNIMFEYSLGNSKLPGTTLIFNMGPASECPSKAKGLCLVPDGKCYALHPEYAYPNCLPYRQRQKAYWLGNTKEKIASDIVNIITTKRVKVDGKLIKLYKYVKKVRFNESGDFWSQDCIDKLDFITRVLSRYGIVVYGYTARIDLDFRGVKFLVKRSGHTKPKTGTNGYFRVVINKKHLKKGEKLCPMDCRKCTLCPSEKEYKIACVLH